MIGRAVDDPSLKNLIRCMDLTTLEATDDVDRIRRLCCKARMEDEQVDVRPYAVCVFPNWVKVAKRELGGSGIRVASVAGGFPLGQSFAEIKCQEVELAVADGADEVDVVISLGKVMQGDFGGAAREIRMMKSSCGEAKLKVILETGVLVEPERIRKASFSAMEGGADFIKTSTGKTSVGASLEAAEIMLQTIQEFHGAHGKRVGFKPAGGIRKAEDALGYLRLVSDILGPSWLDPELFRIGASSLLDDLIARLRSTDPMV
jgi:deoxyribose-phosphate aldolase